MCVASSEIKLDLDLLFRRGLVLRRVRRFYSGTEAEDVAQEVYLRALEKQHLFRGESSPATWLYALTTRYCLNRLRNDGRRRELWLETGDLWAAPITEPRQDDAVLLAELWKKLDPELVLIGVYYYLDGMSHDQIADVMGCSRRTIGNRLVALQAAANLA